MRCFRWLLLAITVAAWSGCALSHAVYDCSRHDACARDGTTDTFADERDGAVPPDGSDAHETDASEDVALDNLDAPLDTSDAEVDVVVFLDVPPDVPPDVRPDVAMLPDVQVDVVDVVTVDVQDVVVRPDVVSVVDVVMVDAAPEADVIAYPPTILFRQDSEPTFGDYFIRYQLPGDVMTSWSSGHCLGGITFAAGNSQCLLDRDVPVGTRFEFYPVRPGGARSCDPPSTCAGYSDRFTLTFGGRTYRGSMPPSPIYLFNETIGPGMLGYFLHVDL